MKRWFFEWIRKCKHDDEKRYWADESAIAASTRCYVSINTECSSLRYIEWNQTDILSSHIQQYTHTDAHKPNTVQANGPMDRLKRYVFFSYSFLSLLRYSYAGCSNRLSISDLGIKMEPYVWWKDIFGAMMCPISGKLEWELRVIERAMYFVSEIFAQLSSLLLRWDDFVSMQP